MLRNPPSLELLQHELRRRVCQHCCGRPPSSEMLGPEAVRICELTCPIFVHLPKLLNAAILTDPMLRSKEEILRHLIEELCHTHGGHCNTPIACPARNPLGCYRTAVINVILDLVGRN